MNWDILESYVEVLIEMIMTGDHNGWEAISKWKKFCADMGRTTEIVKKEETTNE